MRRVVSWDDSVLVGFGLAASVSFPLASHIGKRNEKRVGCLDDHKDERNVPVERQRATRNQGMERHGENGADDQDVLLRADLFQYKLQLLDRNPARVVLDRFL